MILSDKTIKSLYEQGEINISPEPTEEQFQPASLDLRMGDELCYNETGRVETFDDIVSIPPRQVVKGTTLDWIELPKGLSAQITGRSSVGRKGIIVHMTAGYVDPGWRGNLRLEIFNFNLHPVEFDVGERVCQLVFYVLDQESSGYEGQYQDQGVLNHAS